MKTMRTRQHGFTLVELILVIMIAGILAATLAVFLRPALDTWLAMRTRTELSYQAAGALRRMRDEVRLAVPNSIRMPGSQCIELVPTLSGARLRRAEDTLTAGTKPLDTSTVTTEFDVLTNFSVTPSPGDFVVIDNQNPGDVYSGANRARITAVGAATNGAARLTIDPTSFSPGYQGHRVVAVSNSQQAVFYVCEGADGTLDASGNGKGVLARLSSYGFTAAYPGSCPSAGSGTVLASGVRSCRFIYDPSQGATQQSGFVSMQIELARNSESATLVVGAHVANVP